MKRIRPTLQTLTLSTITSTLFLLALNFRYFSLQSLIYQLLVFLPFHRLQVAITLSVLFPLIITVTAAILFLAFRKNSTAAKHLLLTLAGWVLTTHVFIWLLVRPGCITGCEGSAGGNDGYDMVWLVTLLYLPVLLGIVSAVSWFGPVKLSESLKQLIINWNLVYWTFFVTQIVIFLLFSQAS